MGEIPSERSARRDVERGAVRHGQQDAFPAVGSVWRLMHPHHVC